MPIRSGSDYLFPFSSIGFYKFLNLFWNMRERDVSLARRDSVFKELYVQTHGVWIVVENFVERSLQIKFYVFRR